MKERFNVGSIHKVITNVIPKWIENCHVQVITFEDFKKGEVAHQSKLLWRLTDIQKAIFVRYLGGRNPGKVDMMDSGLLTD